MILELSEKNFKEKTKAGKVLVFFYRESGCSFCDKMKPVFEELEGDFVKAKYKLGQSVDSITNGVVQNFPTFGAYVDGVLVGTQEGAMSAEKCAATFDNGFIVRKSAQAPAQIPVEKASLVQLLTDEAQLIDQLGPMRQHLNTIQKEIERRKKLAMGKIDCCDGCAEGNGCGGGH